MKEIESDDDEETLSLKNFNRDLKEINLRDKKPEMRQIPRLEADLPVKMHEREILESIEDNIVTVVCGETGSGKSTQIPKFLFEFGYGDSSRPGLIGVTQPWRIATSALAIRISEELNEKLGESVGYQIRYDASNLSEKTRIKFMTDGILLWEIEADSLLMKYSVIIIDEAHERSVNTDILISLLSRIIWQWIWIAKS